MTKSKSRSSVQKRAGNRSEAVKSEPVPTLKCVQDARSGSNDGVYEVSIPLKYMVKAYECPAAFFVFKFRGMIRNIK